jgi:hypothetical protein
VAIVACNFCQNQAKRNCDAVGEGFGSGKLEDNIPFGKAAVIVDQSLPIKVSKSGSLSDL